MANVTPENSAVWFEIPVSDMKRAKAFYDTVCMTDLQVDSSGPNPMASISVPIARPRIASVALSMITLLWQAAKHAVPQPARKRSANESRYQRENERLKMPSIRHADPSAKTRPL